MDGADIWSELGISPTEELAAIRSAYARKLKAIDVQTDPQAFIALREAYDAARAGMLAIPDWEPEAFTEALETHAPDQARPAEMDVIKDLLHSGERRETIFAPLAGQTKRLVAHAHACDIGQSVAIETWIAEAIVSGIPRSNGMLAPAITGFRWEARAADHDCPYAILVAIERWRDADYLGRLKDINPHYRVAWSALTEGAKDFEAIHPASMSTLLGIIQHQRPALFEDVEMDAFERWIAFLEEQRQADRAAALSAGLQLDPAEEAELRRDDIARTVMTYLMIATGLAADIAMLIHYVVYRGTMMSFGTVALIGTLLLLVGLERRAQQRSHKRLEKAAKRISSDR